MGLMRTISLKRASAIPTRSSSTLKGRPQISLPTELISSTNSLTQTAPSVKLMQRAISETVIEEDDIVTENTSASQSEHKASLTPTTPTSSSSRRCSELSTNNAPSLTDDSSVSSSPSSPEPQFSLSNRNPYFSADSFSKPSSTISVQILAEDSVDPLTTLAPVLPRRAPSHSKREHERLAHRRSQRNLRPVSSAASLAPSSTSAGGVVDELLSPAPSSIMPELPEVDEDAAVVVPAIVVKSPTEPFGEELAQLAEAVEEYGTLIEDEDMRIMRERGLQRWSVSDYLDVVGNAWSSDFVTYSDAVVVA